MRVKAVIFRPDRTNDVVTLKRGQIQGKTFTHNECTYFLNPDRLQITWTRFLWFGPATYYATYYYTMGVAQPLPVPNFQATKEEGKETRFPKVIDQGISAEELAAIFNPWFYRVIGKFEEPWWKQLHFWVSAGACAAAIIAVYLLAQMGNTLEDILRLLGGGGGGGGGGAF